MTLAEQGHTLQRTDHNNGNTLRGLVMGACLVNKKTVEDNAKLKATLPDSNPLKGLAVMHEGSASALSAVGECELAWAAMSSSKKYFKDAQELQKALDQAKPTATPKPQPK